MGAPVFGAIVLDVSGHVVAFNQSIRQIWPAEERLLVVGVPFLDLFKLSESPDEQTTPDSQWRQLRTTAMDLAIRMQTRGARPAYHEVLIRLERSMGGAGTYMAVITAVDRSN